MANKRYMTPVTEITPGFIRGKLTVLHPAEEERDNFGTNQEFVSRSKAKRWLCRCECGNKVIAYEKALLKGTMVSYGCEHPTPDLSGEKSGRLTVMYRLTDSPDARPRWLCQCECGNGVVMTTRQLKEVEVPSCGCYAREQHAIKATTHGMSHTALHKTWVSIRNRCNDPKNKSYPDYGARGIKVCDRWEESFQNFLDDMGPTYQPGLELDRIDNDKGYGPDNCRWVTHLENCRNKRNTIRIDSIYGMLTLGKLAEKTGMKHLTLYNRKKNGVPDQLITVKNATGLRDLKPLFDDVLWMNEQREKRLEEALAEVQAGKK